MYDSYTTAINARVATTHWMSVLTENMTNIYTPGYRENKVNFETFLGGAIVDNPLKNQGQGKSTPGTSNENVFFEGNGFFVTRNDQGKIIYTRLGEFTFDSEGVYRAKNGDAEGGALSIPTTNIKMWIDPNNGKFMGKYDEYEIKEDGTIYGKADSGKRSVPLYKIATANFHNNNGLYEISNGKFVETEESGKPVIGKGSIRSGLLEQSNTDFKGNMSHYQQAKMQMELVNALIKSNKELLEEAMRLVSS